MAFPPFSLSPLSQSIGPHPKKEERQVSHVQSPRLAPRSTLSGHLCPRAQALALDQWVVPAFLCAHGGRLGRTPQDPRPQEEPLQSTWVLQVTNPGTLKMPKPGAAFQLLHGWFCSAKAEEEGITRHLLPALWELET